MEALNHKDDCVQSHLESLKLQQLKIWLFQPNKNLPAFILRKQNKNSSLVTVWRKQIWGGKLFFFEEMYLLIQDLRILVHTLEAKN